MRRELFELASEVLYRPDKVEVFLDTLIEATRTTFAVLLSAGRSDCQPEYRHVTHRGNASRHDIGFLLGASDVVLTWQPKTFEPVSLLATELGHDWGPLFHHQTVLVLPLSGRPLGYKTQAPVPLSGILVLGPLTYSGDISNEAKELLLATQMLLAVSLMQWEIGAARRLVLSLSEEWRDPSADEDVGDLGFGILERVRSVVDFHTGVLYLRGVPSRELADYMVYSASSGEHPDTLLHSYWAPDQLGITFATMTVEKRAVAGKKLDMPEARKATNDHALHHVPSGVHGSWVLMPFFQNDIGVAVAHLEGVNDGRGVTRTQFEALQLLGNVLGGAIHRWQVASGKNILQRTDLSLIEQLYEVMKDERNASLQRTRFEEIVRRSFQAIPGIKIATPDTAIRPDCCIISSDGCIIIVEVTLDKDLTNKRRQLLEYMTHKGADLGILVAGRNLKGTESSEHLAGFERMLIMDLSRLMRFVCLSPIGRRLLVSRWASTSRDGLQMANMDTSARPSRSGNRNQ